MSSLPSRCGEWQEVTSSPVIRVKRVDAFEDLEIKYVTSFPGFPDVCSPLHTSGIVMPARTDACA